jgi:aspartyl-tRNA(Asn)/glutamyl-tRNA(Gln) amidotransferase subunit A
MAGLREGELETASEMATALRAGEVDSAELVERTLRRAEQWQPVTNAFSQLWPDEALDEARRIDGRPADARPPLAGIPIAVKDLYDVAGKETTGCCAAYRGRVAAGDAPVVERIRAAGLIMIGKTNQHELAAGGTNVVSACGATGNPWDPARMTGGSSGGSGAAVAAGVVPWALGSDTGGSIRIPASMCGTFGLKPTTGRLPIEGLLPLCPSMDCPGPMAATSVDLRVLYGIMAGGLEAVMAEGEWLARSTKGSYAIGVPDGFFADRVHPEALNAVRKVAEDLDSVATLSPVDGGGIEAARVVWMSVCCAEFVRAHAGIVRDLVAPSVLEWMELGESLSDRERERAAADRRRIARWFEVQLEDFDALLIPTTPYPAPRRDQVEVDLGPEQVRIDRVGPGWLTCSVNLAGLPAVNLPAGRSSEGMPIGVSLVGAANDEAKLLRLASMWAVASEFRPERPPIPTGSAGA